MALPVPVDSCRFQNRNYQSVTRSAGIGNGCAEEDGSGLAQKAERNELR